MTSLCHYCQFQLAMMSWRNFSSTFKVGNRLNLALAFVLLLVLLDRPLKDTIILPQLPVMFDVTLSIHHFQRKTNNKQTSKCRPLHSTMVRWKSSNTHHSVFHVCLTRESSARMRKVFLHSSSTNSSSRCPSYGKFALQAAQMRFKHPHSQEEDAGEQHECMLWSKPVSNHTNLFVLQIQFAKLVWTLILPRNMCCV